MHCYWLNFKLCLDPENDEEIAALSAIHHALRAAGLTDRPGRGISAPEYNGTWTYPSESNDNP